MTTTARTFRAFALEPIELAISQPHQFLISSASVSIVALEAGTLIPWPANLALAIGAEWAYLRGLISGSGIKTRWAAALNWSAVLLVVLYGSLWGLRQFRLIPEAPAPWLAVLLTAIHIGAIGAVTICSAMLHRVGVEAEQVLREKQLRAEAERNQQKVASEEERTRKLQEAEDALRIEMRRKDAEMRLMEETARRKLQLRLEARAATARQVAGATKKQPIIIDNVEYPSVQAAADAHGISRQAMSKRLRKEGQL